MVQKVGPSLPALKFIVNGQNRADSKSVTLYVSFHTLLLTIHSYLSFTYDTPKMYTHAVFVYHPNQDSVLQVTRDAYDSCNTDAPTAKFADGKTSFALTHSGPYYFISGNKDHCNKNEKLVVIVMADRSGNNNTTTTSSSPPSPAPAPSPPMEGTLEPPAATPTPSQETPNNAASPSSSSVAAALLGAALASTLFLH